MQWKPRIDAAARELKKATSVLRLSYLAEIESESLVKQRLAAIKREIETAWKREGAGYDLTIETEVFWRQGRLDERVENCLAEIHVVPLVRIALGLLLPAVRHRRSRPRARTTR